MTERDEESNCIGHEPCPACGSKDNLARYSDGHGYCFGCSHYERSDVDNGNASDGNSSDGRLGRDSGSLRLVGDAIALPKRGINADTCKIWKYHVGNDNGRNAQFAFYLDPNTRQPIAAKVRYPDKTFKWIGDHKAVGLYGQWLWRDAGKMVVVTEGELDAISVSQLQSNKWPVVSIPNGAQSAVKAIRKSLDWLSKFDSVVLMFDMDEPGRQAAVECAKLFPPGKAKIASLEYKDANEALQAGKGSHVIDAIWSAKEYRPDGIVNAADLWEQVSSTESIPCEDYPYPGLTLKTGGIRKRELVTITAGSGIGKSLFCREIAYDLLVNKGWKVGYIALEENNARTLLGLMGIHLSRPLHLTKDGTDGEELRESFEAVSANLSLYDSFGSVDPDNLLDRLRYLAVGMQCDALFLDHISIAVSGLEDIDERRALDVMMTRLRSLVEETGVAMFVVSHLKRPSQSDKGHEQGLQTTLAQLRGSAAIGQLSDMVIGLERNQQGDDPNETIVRVLKNRFSGDTGTAGSLHYNKETGRLTEEAFQKEDAYAQF